LKPSPRYINIQLCQRKISRPSVALNIQLTTVGTHATTIFFDETGGGLSKYISNKVTILVQVEIRLSKEALNVCRSRPTSK
jgi:hypothetical protein